MFYESDSKEKPTETQAAHTPGPWTACQMVHAERGDLLTPEEIGEYVCNSVKKSAEASGSLGFLFVSAEKPDGPADVCHVGNGPTSPANARLIAAAPELLAAAKDAQCSCSTEQRLSGHLYDCWMPALLEAIAKAEGREGR